MGQKYFAPCVGVTIADPWSECSWQQEAVRTGGGAGFVAQQPPEWLGSCW